MHAAAAVLDEIHDCGTTSLSRALVQLAPGIRHETWEWPVLQVELGKGLGMRYFARHVSILRSTAQERQESQQ